MKKVYTSKQIIKLLFIFILGLSISNTAKSQIVDFGLFSPASGTTITVEGNGNNSIDFVWHEASSSTIAYSWRIDYQGAPFQPGLDSLVSNNGGLDTMITISYATLNQYIESSGIGFGDTLKLKWIVQEENATHFNTSDTFLLYLESGLMFSDFSAFSPASGTTHLIEGLNSDNMDFSWHTASSSTSTYQWRIDLAGGTYSPGLGTFVSNNSGIDTMLTISYEDLNGIILSTGTLNGDTVALDWFIEEHSIAGINHSDTLTILLVKGEVVEGFKVLKPNDMSYFLIEGENDQMIDFSWFEVPSSTNSTLKYEVKMDISGGNYSPGVGTYLSTNSGLDTTLSLSYALMDSILDNQGSVEGDTLDLEWYVEETNTSSTQVSDTFKLSLVNGVIFMDFSLLSPASGTYAIDGNANDAIDFIWEFGSSSSTTYNWKIDTVNGNYLPGLADINTGGDTSLSISYFTIDSLMFAYGARNNGDTLNLNWYVEENTAAGVNLSNDTLPITFIKGNVFKDFGLNEPGNNDMTDIGGISTNSIHFAWERSGTGVFYELFLTSDKSGTNTIYQQLADNSGKNTFADISKYTLDTLLANNGTALHDTGDYYWYVKGTDSSTVWWSTDTFKLQIKRGGFMDMFSLISPTSTSLRVISGKSTRKINFRWQSAGDNVEKYIWYLDSSISTFKNPWARLDLGSDTAVSLNYSQIDSVLASIGTKVGAQKISKWGVVAVQSGDSLVPHNSKLTDDITLGIFLGINFERGSVIYPFDQLSPSHQSNLNLAGRGDQIVRFDWSTSGVGSTEYNYYLTYKSDTIYQITQADTSIEFSYSYFDTILENAGIPISAQNDTLTWSVFSTVDGVFLESTNGPFELDFVRGEVMDLFDLISIPSNTSKGLDLEGYEWNTFHFNWENSGSNDLTYVWMLDELGGTFNSPLLVHTTTGGITDLDVTYREIEDVLIGMGVPVGTSQRFSWKIKAFNGTDSLEASNAPFSFRIIRRVLLDNFTNEIPVDSFGLRVEGHYKNQLEFSWSKSGKTFPFYQFIMDTSDLAEPMVAFDANMSGIDSSYSYEFGEIDHLLEGLGLGDGDDIDMIWGVRAISGDDTLLTTSSSQINFERGRVMFPFGLESLKNNSTFDVEGIANQELDFVWKPSGLNGINYHFILDSINGDLVSTMLSDVTNDTVISVSLDSMNNFLINSGLNFGTRLFSKWTIYATEAGDTIETVDTFALRLGRATVVDDFDIIFPTNNLTVVVQGDGKKGVDMLWQNASPTGEPIYEFMIDYPGNNFSSPLNTIRSNNNGSDTALTLTFSDLNNSLSGLGLNVGDTFPAIWNVRAVAGVNALFANNGFFDIDLVKGDVIDEYNLHSPINNYYLDVTGLSSQNATFTWESSGEGSYKYYVIIDTIGGDFSNPLFQFEANNSGTDTFFTIPYIEFEKELESLGLKTNDIINGIWTVNSIAAGDTVKASNGPYNIDIRKGSVIQEFDLISPTGGDIVLIEGEYSQDIEFMWQSSGQGDYSYEIVIDSAGGIFSPPLISLTADNNGRDSSLIIDYDQIDVLLKNAGIGLGDTLEATWAVRSTEGRDVQRSVSERPITFIRRVLTNDFNILGPVDSSAYTIPGNALPSQQIFFSWESAQHKGKGDLKYELLFDNIGGGFANPLLSFTSNNNGIDPNFEISYNDFHNELKTMGVSQGDEKAFDWTVKGYFTKNGTEQQVVYPNNADVSSPFVLFLTRGVYIGIDEIRETTKVTLYPNPSDGEFFIEFDELVTNNVDLTITDMSGRVVFNQLLNSNQKVHHLFFGNLKSGLYHVNLRNDNYSHTARIIIK